MAGGRALKIAVGLVVAVEMTGGGWAQEVCGSAVLGERARPAVFQGITLGPSAVSRLWSLGSASQDHLDGACGAGCRSFSASPLCDGGGDCTAVTGIEWLDGSCAAAGFLPQTSVLLLEAPTADDGGRWAAIKVEHPADYANFDLDAAAAAICGSSCATLARPYVGGGQGIGIRSATVSGGVLELKLWWEPAKPSAQALNEEGGDLISSYAVYVARSSGGTAPGMTGAKAGWTRVDDTDASSVGGYSTDTRATVSIDLGGSNEAVYVAMGINLDGTGNPDTDADTVASSFLSRGVEVWAPGGSGPLVTAVVPADGPVTGGTRLIVSGVKLDNASTVTVGGNPATEVTPVSANRVWVTAPAGTEGPADVMVTTGGGTGTLTGAYRYEEMEPAGLAVDASASGGSSNVNGVLEPGERVTVSPTWRNLGADAVDLSGHAGGLVGPGGTGQWTRDSEAVYGSIGPGEKVGCADDSPDCYEVEVGTASQRPAQHWDLHFEEVLSTGQRKSWTLHVGQSFDDVPMSHWAYRFVETLLHFGVTTGCGGNDYCPGTLVTRAQMAAFLIRSIEGPDYEPKPCTMPPYDDVPCWRWFSSWVTELKDRGITTGCHDNDYCPFDSVTRAQMAKFLLKAKWGGDYEPPACTSPPFDDVPCWKWFAPWVAELKAEAITTGCNAEQTKYCPYDSVTRAAMAAFLTRTFGLELYGSR